jgi:peptidoglycan hydrolase-like protein with peptidoglycan-binding domain
MRRAIVVSAGCCVVAVAAGGVLVAGAGGDGGPAPAATAGGATAPVERRTLVDRQRADGTLGYGDARKVANRLPGTITWLPSSGARVRRGERLFEVDEKPVILLDGKRPAYRRMARGMSGGEDVRQLERNLVALGYDPYRAITIDRTFDAATAAAVRRWRKALGLPAGSAVELGRVVFLPGTRRVTELSAQVGDAAGGGAGGPTLTTTANRQHVTLELAAADASVAHAGQRVDVELPDSSHVRGRVARVGTVATAASDQNGGSGDPTITVTVTLLGKRRGLDRAPVSVELARSARRNVLAVPVTALLAQRGGGYALQLAAGRRLVPVTTGLFADGYVEVRGAALREGQRVTVPAS